jgi:hypothetical protein
MNSLSGIVNRPASIQFGSDRRPVPRIIDEVRTEESNTFIDVEDTLPKVHNRPVHWDIHLPALLPPLPQLPEHLTQPPLPLVDNNETTTSQASRRAPRFSMPILSRWHSVRNTMRNINLPTLPRLPWLQRRSGPQPQSTPTTIPLANRSQFPTH